MQRFDFSFPFLFFRIFEKKNKNRFIEELSLRNEN
jgi:hypothetical protein